MPRTAPAPNALVIPGMNPGLLVGGGGGGAGGSGGGSGSGSGKGGSGATSSSDKDAEGGGKEAPDPAKYPVCGSKGHPVDVITGRAYTHPIVDFALPGPLPLIFARVCSSAIARQDLGLGPSWAHSLGWRLQVRRRDVRVFTDKGTVLELPQPKAGETVVGPWGWRLKRSGERDYSLDADDDGVWRHFRAEEGERPWCRLTALEDRNHNRITLSYDEQQRLAFITDSAGRVLRARSDGKGRLESLSVSETTPSPGEAAQGPWRQLVSYRYDERGALTEVTDADGFKSHYTYDQRGRMTADSDRTGLTFHFVYDAEDRCVESWGDYAGKPDPSLADDVPTHLVDSQIPAKGVHHCTFDYLPDHYTEVCDSTGVSRFEGNARGTVETWCDGPHTWTYAYDDDGFLIGQSDPLQAATFFKRDARGKLLGMTDPLGRQTTVERDPSGLPVRLIDPEGAQTRVWRDARGNIESIQDAAGGITQFRRDARGLVTEAHYANGGTARFDYDAHGNLASRRDPNGAEWRYEHDALGRRTAVTDPLGAQTRYRYSARGDLREVHDALGGITRYGYDGEHHLLFVSDPGGRTTRFEWGGYHRLCSRTDANGNTVRLRYNREGELLHVINEQGQVHSFQYDSTGRLVGEDTFDGRQLRYQLDPCGRPLEITNRTGSLRVQYEYDLAGQLILRGSSHDSDEFAYNGRGELISAKNDAVTCTFARDPLGRIIAETQTLADELYHPAQGDQTLSLSASYDPLGNRKSRHTSLGHSELIERDAMGARTQTLLDGRLHLTHQHDLLSREVARQLPAGALLESHFDPLGRLHARRVQVPGTALARAAGDPEWLGPQTSLTYEKQYDYDLSSELVTVWDKYRGPTRYEYDRIGQLLASIPSNDNEPGGRDTRDTEPGKDARGPGAGGQAERGSSPPAPGNQDPRGSGPGGPQDPRSPRPRAGADAPIPLLGNYDAAPSGPAGGKPYDPSGDLGVLAGSEEPREERFSYDPAGNLYDPSGRDYKPTNQITRRDNTRYFWTADGQLGEKETQTPQGREHTYYRWNHNGLLEEVTLPDGRQLTFHYDSFARRVLKRVLGPPRLGQAPLLKETRFFWDGQRLVHEITRNLATITPDGPQPIVTYPESTPSDPEPEPRLLPAELRTYCHEDGSYALLAGRLPDGTWAYYVNDGIGTPEALVDETGKPLGELERRAWKVKDPRGLTPFRFPGQYEDEETGLCYNRYRYYDPETGRFVSADPVGLRGGANVFSYAPNAVGWRDPLGLTGEQGARQCAAADFQTGANEAVFWSGRTAGVGGADVAAGVAKAKGGRTLEQVIAARGIHLPPYDPADPSSVKAWDNASLALAQGASGKVHAVIGESLRPGNVWERVEYPALKSNPNVTQITKVDPATGSETVLFTR